MLLYCCAITAIDCFYIAFYKYFYIAVQITAFECSLLLYCFLMFLYCCTVDRLMPLYTIGYIYFRFFTNCKKFDFSDSFSFDYDPNGISLGL